MKSDTFLSFFVGLLHTIIMHVVYHNHAINSFRLRKIGVKSLYVRCNWAIIWLLTAEHLLVWFTDILQMSQVQTEVLLFYQDDHTCGVSWVEENTCHVGVLCVKPVYFCCVVCNSLL